MSEQRSCDSVRNPSHVLALWIVPGGIAAIAFVGAARHPALLLLGSAACLLMGIACLVNAARCQRLHCYVTGPYFLALALGAGVGFAFDTSVADHIHGWLLLALGLAPILVWLPERLAGSAYRKGSGACAEKQFGR